MKKLFFFLTTLLVFTSCEEDVKFNNPSMQAMNGEVLFRATDPRVTYNLDGGITISGEFGFETMELKIASAAPGIYKFGLNSNTVAYYKYDADGLVLEYSTIGGVENPDLQSDLGQIIIYEPTHPKASKTPGTISGEFKFNGKLINNNPFGAMNVFFQDGHFYGLKLQDIDTGGDDDDDDIQP